MGGWRDILRADPTGWLIEPGNPSVRYFTLVDLLERPLDEPQVLEAKRAIGASRPVNRIFSKQKPGGFWESEAQPYKPKYKSTYWQLMILGMLGLDRSDERVRRAVDYIWRFQHEDGGFCSEKEEGAHIEYVKVGERLARKGKSLPPFEEWAPGAIRESEMTCLTGNVCAALIRMGYADDRRVRKALDWLVEVQNRDGGWLCPHWRAHIRDKHGCFMGTITPLDAFTEFPERLRTLEMSEAVSRGAKFLLMHRLYKADHHGFRIINDSWLSLGFPRFGYDILRGLDVVTRLDYSRDERINDALDVLLRRRDPDGRWILDHTPSGRMQTNLEQKGRPSKWVTLNALRVLKRVYQSKSAYITGLFGLPHESQYD